MPGRPRLLLAAFLIVVLVPSAARAQLASSDFATDADGWSNVTLPYPSAVPPTITFTYAPVWVPTLGGYVTLNDPDGTGVGDCQYWRAPVEYLGFQSAAYGGKLEFDLASSGSGHGTFDQEDLILIGGGLTLVGDLAVVSDGLFHHYLMPMSESGWRVGGSAGPPATVQQMKTVLFHVEDLYIRAEYELGPDVQYLDNVLLSAPASTGVGTIASTFDLSAPFPNPSSGSSRVAFTLPRAARGQVEILDASGRRLATLASGTYESGPHRVTWDGRDQAGHRVPSGLYWVRAEFGGQRATRRLVRFQ